MEHEKEIPKGSEGVSPKQSELTRRLGIGQVGHLAGTQIPFIGTQRGHERLSDTVLDALAFRYATMAKEHARLLRITVGLAVIAAAEFVWLAVAGAL